MPRPRSWFSSRRRHTGLQGDWSSDVCSSDLNWLARTPRSRRSKRGTSTSRILSLTVGSSLSGRGSTIFYINSPDSLMRSEERRVGKARRAGRGAEDERSGRRGGGGREDEGEE